MYYFLSRSLSGLFEESHDNRKAPDFIAPPRRFEQIGE